MNVGLDHPLVHQEYTDRLRYQGINLGSRVVLYLALHDVDLPLELRVRSSSITLLDDLHKKRGSSAADLKRVDMQYPYTQLEVVSPCSRPP